MSMPVQSRKKKLSDFDAFLRKKDLIFVVGSGSLDSFPKPGCHCRLCEIARKGGKDQRLPASSIYYRRILFDIGPGVWDRIENRDVKPQAIVLSHLHYDHLADLLRYKKLSYRLPVYASSLFETLLTKLKIRANYYDPDSSFEVGGVKIDTRVAIHTFTRPVSLLKFDKILYAPDIGELRTGDLRFAQRVRLWFGDGFSLDEDFVIRGEKLHMSMKDQMMRLKQIESLKKLIFLGIGHHSKFPHEDLEILIKDFELENNFHFSAELGFDGQLIPSPRI